MQQKVRTDAAQDYTEAEWQARVDLAAAHRICVMEGLHEGIFACMDLADSPAAGFRAAKRAGSRDAAAGRNRRLSL